MELLLLCWEFFKTGLFAIGGGMATIPFLTQMSEAHPQWFTMEMLANMIAVSESTPGPIGVNMATYVGFVVYGVPGAVLATFSLVLPAFIVVILVARALYKYRSSPLVEAGFAGLRPAVTGLIAAAGYSVFSIAVLPGGALDIRATALFLLVFAVTQWKKTSKVHPVVLITLSAVIGVVFQA